LANWIFVITPKEIEKEKKKLVRITTSGYLSTISELPAVEKPRIEMQ
jgi:hypothetical protein